MKKFKGLVSQFKPSKVVVAFARFNPLTADHSMLVLAVNKLAIDEGASHKIFVLSEAIDTPVLPIDRSLHYLRKAYPKIEFEQASTVESALASLDYKTITVVANSDSINTLYESLDLRPITKSNPDNSILGLKLLEAAKSGDITALKACLPHTMTTVDSRLMLNDIRHTFGLDPIRTSITTPSIALREQYIDGKLFAIGDIVECDGTIYRIKKCSSNHLLLQSEDGTFVNKWLQDVKKTESPYTLQGALFEMKFTSSDKIKVARIIATTLGIENADKNSNAENLVNAGLRKVKSKAIRPEYLAVLKKMTQTATDVGIAYDTSIIPALKEGI